MKLFKFSHQKDFGHDWYFHFVNVRDISLLQFSVSWNDYPAWPFIQIKSGNGSVLNVLFWAYRFGLDIDILSRSWHMINDSDEENELD